MVDVRLWLFKRPLWVLLFVTSLMACEQQRPEGSALDLNAALGGKADAGFVRAIEKRDFHFPADHRAHPDFRNEWWYVTGNVQTDSGRHFGYQVTFFRIALTPDNPQTVARHSVWATNQVWMAHIALSDIAGEQHYHDQRFARGAAGLAGQTDQPFKVWLEDWQIIAAHGGEFPWVLDVGNDSFRLNLQLMPEKPGVLQGDGGLSQKSSAVGNASYYYSFSRLSTVGDIYLHNDRHVVVGNSWLDREWSTSVLADDQVGWDWFSLQLNDGHDFMFYRLRKKEGRTDKHSAGKWISPDGSAVPLGADDVVLEPVRYWIAEDGRNYPVEWQLNLVNKGVRFRIEAMLDNQLMTTGIVYWEGAVRVRDAASGSQLGTGYLEMAGY